MFDFINHVVAKVDPVSLPDGHLRRFYDAMRSLKTSLRGLGTFDPEKIRTQEKGAADPFHVRDQLIATVREAHDQVFTDLAPIIAGGTQMGDDLATISEIARGVVGEVSDDLRAKRDDAVAMLDELRSLAAKAKESAQETGVATHGRGFGDAADSHRSAAIAWLVLVGALLILAGGLATWSLVWTFNHRATIAKLSPVAATQFTISKLVIASLVGSAIVWSARMYRAHRHNEIVNRHRQRALTTFETFVKATKDEQTKSAVLLQTTESIFSPQATGYMGEEADVGGGPKIIEIVRGIAESGKR